MASTLIPIDLTALQCWCAQLRDARQALLEGQILAARVVLRLMEAQIGAVLQRAQVCALPANDLQDFAHVAIARHANAIAPGLGFELEGGACPHGHRDWDDCPVCRH
jgi:hypothetical protein